MYLIPSKCAGSCLPLPLPFREQSTIQNLVEQSYGSKRHPIPIFSSLSAYTISGTAGVSSLSVWSSNQGFGSSCYRMKQILRVGPTAAPVGLTNSWTKGMAPTINWYEATTKQKGRGLYVREKPFQVGESVCRVEPIAAISFSHCSWCFAGSVRRCGQCRAVAYCSRTCQRADWTLHHRMECSSMKDMAKAKTTPTLWLACRVLLSTGGSWADLEAHPTAFSDEENDLYNQMAQVL